MNLKNIALLIILSFSPLYPDNYSHKIIWNQCFDNPQWNYEALPIRLKHPHALQDLIQVWNGILQTQWLTLHYKIQNDFHLSLHQLLQFLDYEIFINYYMSLYNTAYPELIEEEEIDPFLKNYVSLTFNYLGLKNTPHIRCKNNIINPAITFGTDQQGHYLVLNDNIYNHELIENIYESLNNKETHYYLEPHTQFSPSRMIELQNYLHLGLAITSSSIMHKADYFGKFLYMILYNNRSLSHDTKKFGEQYITFLTYIEGCLQSNNPLEAVIFLKSNIENNFNQTFVSLWHNFITDIKNCYHEDDLQAYQTFIASKRISLLLKK